MQKVSTFSHGATALVGQDFDIEASRSHLDTAHSVGLLWTSDQPVTGTSTFEHKHSQETDIHPSSGIRTRNPASERPQHHGLDRAATGDRQIIIYTL
jgi:hypothetical protein